MSELLNKLGYTEEDIKGLQQPSEAPVQPPVEAPVQPQGSMLENYLNGLTDTLTSNPAGSSAGIVGLVNPVMKYPAQMIDQAMMEQYAGEAGDIGGSILGAMQGAKFGPRGVIAGAVGGAMLGRAAGETVQDVLGDEFDILDTLTESAKSGAWALAGEGLGVAVSKLIPMIKAVRAGSTLTKEQAAEMVQLNEMLKNSNVKIVDGNVRFFEDAADIPKNAVDVTLTPAQVTESPWRRGIERLAKGGFGGGQIDTLYEAQSEALRRYFGQEVAMMGNKDPRAFGQAFQNAYEQIDQELVAFIEPKYKELNALANKAQFNFSGLRSSLRQMMEQGTKDFITNSGKKINARSVTSLVKALPAEQAKELTLLLQRTNKADFSTGFADVKRLTKLARELRETEGKAQYAKDIDDIITVYRSTLMKQSEKLAGAEGGTMRDLYREMEALDLMYGEAYKLTKSDFAKDLLEQFPSQVAKMVFSGDVPEKVTKVFTDSRELAKWSKKLQGKGIDPKAIISDFKATYADRFVRQLTEATGDNAVDVAAKQLDMLDPAIGRPEQINMFKAMFNPAERKRLVQGLKYADKMEKISSGNVSLAVRGQQSAGIRKAARAGVSSLEAALGIGAGSFAGAPAAIVGGLAFFSTPAIVARNSVKGKLTEEILQKALGIASKGSKGAFDTVRDGTALLTLVTKVATTPEDLPPELVREGEEELSVNQIIFRRKLELHNRAMEM